MSLCNLEVVVPSLLLVAVEEDLGDSANPPLGSLIVGIGLAVHFVRHDLIIAWSDAVRPKLDSVYLRSRKKEWKKGTEWIYQKK